MENPHPSLRAPVTPEEAERLLSMPLFQPSPTLLETSPTSYDPEGSISLGINLENKVITFKRR
jgi:hypothetical protein